MKVELWMILLVFNLIQIIILFIGKMYLDRQKKVSEGLKETIVEQSSAILSAQRSVDKMKKYLEIIQVLDKEEDDAKAKLDKAVTMDELRTEFDAANSRLRDLRKNKPRIDS